MWQSLFAQVDKSPAEIGAGPQAPVETDGYEDGDGYGEGYGDEYDWWWGYMKKEEDEDDPENTTVKDVHDLGGDGDRLEEVEVEEEPEPPMERPTKKVRTPHDDGEDSQWQGGQSYTHAGSSRDTRDDDWWQGGGEPWKSTWWWDTQWSDRDWKSHDRKRSKSKGKGKGQHAPWAYTNPKGKGKKGRGKVDSFGGQYVRGGYSAPDGTFFPYLVSNFKSFVRI